MAALDRISTSPRLRRIARAVAGPVGLNHLVRVEPVLNALRDLGGGELLDVGSGSVGLAPWARGQFRVTATDTHFDDYGAATGPSGMAARTVVADVRELPFDDRSFDAVVALDLLEHVAAGDRAQALGELTRVTRTRLIVACPTGAEALAADHLLAGSMAAPPGWLDEHLQNGFPEREAIAEALRPHGALQVFANESVASHVRLVRAELSPLAFAPTRAAARLAAWTLRRGGRLAQTTGGVLWWVRGKDAEPAYRTIFVLDVAREAPQLQDQPQRF
jgi:Methyltransferase domain